MMMFRVRLSDFACASRMAAAFKRTSRSAAESFFFPIFTSRLDRTGLMGA